MVISGSFAAWEHFVGQLRLLTFRSDQAGTTRFGICRDASKGVDLFLYDVQLQT